MAQNQTLGNLSQLLTVNTAANTVAINTTAMAIGVSNAVTMNTTAVKVGNSVINTTAMVVANCVINSTSIYVNGVDYNPTTALAIAVALS